MVGGLINIVSYGFNDLYLTGSPQITFFKVVYRRHTNFAKESIVVPMGQLDLGEELTINIPKIGDLFANTYLQLQIPEVALLKTDTADNLSIEEMNLLNSPLQIPMSQDEIDIVQSYPTILAFIAINTVGYRSAIANQNIKNQNIRNFITSIINNMNYSGQENTSYKTALDNAKIFEQSAGTTSDLFIFDNTASDINYILSKIIESDDDTLAANYTISKIVDIVTKAKDVSAKVKKYYFEKVQKKYKMDKDANSRYAKFAWVEKLGYAIIDRVDINIGGERIDRHYGDWMNIWYELTSSIEQEELMNKMIGNVKVLTSFDRNTKPAYTLIVPLNFWFCKKMGLAFPLIALQYSPVSITLKLKTMEECAYIEQLPQTDPEGDPLNLNPYSLSDIWDNQGYSITADLLVEYIYLDNLERKRFAQSAHEYLIETVEVLTSTNVRDQEQEISLDFTGPSKEIIWHVKKDIHSNFESTYRKFPFTYSMDVVENGSTVEFKDRKKINTITSARLLLNGKDRFFQGNFFDKNYYNLLQPLEHHTRIPSEGINVYSFSLYPEEHQPSSTCNFSLISTTSLLLTVEENMFKYLVSDVDPSITVGSEFDEELNTSVNITIYSVRYNIIRFIGGMGAFAYSYSVTK